MYTPNIVKVREIQETHVDQSNKSIYSRKRYYSYLKVTQRLLLICTRHVEIRTRSPTIFRYKDTLSTLQYQVPIMIAIHIEDSHFEKLARGGG